MTEDQGYSVKEVVDLTRKEQSEGFNRVEVLLSSKADKADLGPIHQRLDEHDGHIRTLQDAVLIDATEDARKVNRSNNIKWFIGVSTIIAATALGTILAHIFH